MSGVMPKQFAPPANWDDFGSGQGQEKALFLSDWTLTLNQLIEQGIAATAPNGSFRNPLTTDIPPAAPTQDFDWVAFPNRLTHYYGNLLQSTSQLWQCGDTGRFPDGSAFPSIPAINCPAPDFSPVPNPDNLHPFGPTGPRGWQDDYCEWSVQRDPASNKITKVMFTCENPEYWYTLWRIDPALVCDIYQKVINPAVSLEDLYLMAGGAPVTDPQTGQPAYNPLNKWNSGTTITPDSGGAMHLTSTGNLGGEIGLAAGATVLYQQDSDPNTLNCCGQIGEWFRNSDTLIAFNVNRMVKTSGLLVALAEPVGLYIEDPSFGAYDLPANAPSSSQPSDFWKIVRGSSGMGLHAVYEVPEGLGFTVGDMTIAGSPIEWASQIARTFKIGMSFTGIPNTGSPPTPQPCVQSNGNGATLFQLMFEELWQAYLAAGLASNASMAAPVVRQGQTGVELVLICLGGDPDAAIEFPEGGITVTKTGFAASVPYTPPSFSYSSNAQVYTLSIDVAGDAQLGQRTILVTNPGQPSGASGICFLTVIPE